MILMPHQDWMSGSWIQETGHSDFVPPRMMLIIDMLCRKRIVR